MYRMYVDEVGTDGLTHLDKDKHQFLSLTGVIMKIDHARDFLVPRINKIKADVFKNDPDSPIVLHRKEIMGLKGPFGVLKDPKICESWNTEILKIFEECEYTVITALIDKGWMITQQHWAKTQPYHYLMEILVEKYAQFLERMDDIGDIMPESRHHADRRLQAAFTQVKRGTDFVSGDRIKSVIRADKLKFRKKKDDIAGLQLCDLLAHPSHIYVRTQMKHAVNLGPFAERVARELVNSKYDRRDYDGRIRGYGIKHLP